MNERGCWTKPEEVSTHGFDKSLCEEILNLFSGTFVDIGCGDGSYARLLATKNDVKCFDGSPLTTEISKGFCAIKDFSYPQDIGEFDVVLSLEVGEHIPQEFEQIFIDNLCQASGRWIILSWAIVGQGGVGHVNCRDNWYIIRELRKSNFELDIEKTKKLREASTIPWFKNTLMVFEWIH